MQKLNNLSQYLEHEVYPAIWRRLDSAFPEFGWRQKGHFWVATVESITRNLPGSPRPDRVVAYENTPFGFVIQGASLLTWIEYVSGSRSPKGIEFIQTVRKLCDAAGLAFPETIQNARDRAQDLLEAVVNITHVELLSERGEIAKRYLSETRGLREEHLLDLEIGYFPSILEIHRKLKLAGYHKQEIDDSGILADSRWEGRIIGPWRTYGGQIINFWTRDISGKAENAEKYLMLKGGKKSAPFGMESARGKELIIVEGILDTLVLKAAGFKSVVGIGGTNLKCDLVDFLLESGFQSVTLNFDYDGPHGPGHEATIQAVSKLSAAHCPVFVIPPEAMANPKAPDRKVDPDSFIREKGVDAYRELLDQRVHIFRYKARRLIEKHPGETDSHLVALLREANEFAGQVLKNPEKRTDLYLFFWQELFVYLGFTAEEWEKYLSPAPAGKTTVPLLAQVA